MKHPRSIITFPKTHPSVAVHPTEKPIALMEWIVKTFSDEESLILDPTIGCGSTAIACKNTNRHFIGIEMNQEYIDIALKRLGENNDQLAH
jgi:DNA modification methylase